MRRGAWSFSHSVAGDLTEAGGRGDFERGRLDFCRRNSLSRTSIAVQSMPVSKSSLFTKAFEKRDGLKKSCTATALV
jgi:hypothetical protein